jgi:hypothetical protein
MKNVVINSAALLCLAGGMAELAITPADAQQAGGTQIQQQSQHLDAATLIGNNHSSATTLTLTPPSGQYLYLTSVHIENCASATVTVAVPTSVISTGFSTSGSPSFEIQSGTTSGLCSESNIIWPQALKSQNAGTNVTFVTPAFATNQIINFEVSYYFSP